VILIIKHTVSLLKVELELEVQVCTCPTCRSTTFGDLVFTPKHTAVHVPLIKWGKLIGIVMTTAGRYKTRPIQHALTLIPNKTDGYDKT